MGRYRLENRRLADRLLDSVTPTIDEFVIACSKDGERNRILAAMTDVLWQLEDSVISSKPRFERDWLSWLYHKRCSRDPETFESNNVVFVSFNYDRLPQLRIAKMMANFFERSGQSCWNIVHTSTNGYLQRFLHVHGQIDGSVAADETSSSVRSKYAIGHAYDACKNLTVLDDSESARSGGMMAEFARNAEFNEVWEWADRILLLGTGYHVANLNAIRLTRPVIDELTKSGTAVLGTGYGLKSERSRIRDLVGDRFKLGDDEQDCLAFLEDNLPPD